MVTVFNKTNKPIGIIGGQYCLPDKSMVLKDKDAFVDVFDEDGNATGEKQLLPGLKAMEIRGYITIDVKEDKPMTKKAVEKVVETEVAEEKPVKKTTRKTTKKVEE